MEKQIIAILEHYKLNNAQFAEKLDIQRSNVSHILSGRNKPSLDLIQKILINFPKISSDWLLFEKGDMHKSIAKKENQQTPSPTKATTTTNSSPNFAHDSLAPTKKEKKKSDKKSTEKIIIFHNDQTYTEYLPRED